jgi:lipoprotein-anchoring transpeptidase ErfK/SrfK
VNERRLRVVVVAAAVVSLGLAACGQPTRPALLRAPVTTEVPFRLVAEVHDTVPSIDIFDAPGAPAPKLRLPSRTVENTKRVFLVRQQQGTDWLQILLPVRPNGSTGWIRPADVDLKETTFRLRVELGAHRITVWNGNDVIDDESVGVGTAAAPTPPGEYYITEALVVPSFQRAAYGPFAFALSGHSNVYTSFGGGDGTLAIHGTAASDSIGKDASHGCIRMANDGITKLIHLVPLGSPVEITA